MSTANSNGALLTQELNTLKVLRASLQAVLQFVEAVGEDAGTIERNCEHVTELSKRWQAVAEDVKSLELSGQQQ